jgi:lauroyl/myristoyl acyltransferase
MDDDRQQKTDLDTLLARARQRSPIPARPPVSLRARGSEALRRWQPARLAVRSAEARGRALWERDAAERRRAELAISAVVGATDREAEIEALARAHLIEGEIQRALFWQPWKMALLDSESAETLHSTLSHDRGVLVSSCHMGPMFLHLAPVMSLGRTGYTVAGPWWFDEPTPDEGGRRLAHWHRRLRERNQRYISANGSYPVLRELLRQRELVVIYFDLPGSRQTQFLGKPVMMASGSARLACETDSLVLPVRARRQGLRAWTDVHAPLDPRGYATPDDLHDALAEVHERWILELPATVEDPRRAGAWEEASAQAWPHPKRVRVGVS